MLQENCIRTCSDHWASLRDLLKEVASAVNMHPSLRERMLRDE